MAFRMMAADDLQGGTVNYSTAKEIDATVGVFENRPDLVNGGYSKHLSAMVEVADEDLPDNAVFKNGQFITVNPTTGQSRVCKIKAFTQSGALWHLDVMDENENA